MIGPLVEGFALTFKHLFRKPITVNYPDQKIPMFPRYRGKQVLMRDENGLEKCVACGLCAVACPADAIYLEAAENDGTVMAGPRYASIYQIHKTRCIFCGYCEEACPVSAIFMGKDYELAVYSKDDFVWDKTELLVPAADESACARARDAVAAVASLVKPFLDALDDRVLVCDGAMGTMLYGKGVFINRCFESLNLTQPDLVVDVHERVPEGRRGRDRDQHLRREPHEAARLRPGRSGPRDQPGGAQCWRARRVTRVGEAKAYVAGAIGPLGVRVEPWGKTGIDEAEAMFREQAQALLDGEVDLFILETFRDLNEIGAAIAAVRSDLRSADRRADDHGRGWQQPRRCAARAVRAGAHQARSERRRR